MDQRFETFTVLINRISRNIRKIKNQEMAEYNLKSHHISCLYFLFLSDEGLTATELCERCEEDKATISRALDYLESSGYLTCTSESHKRYKSLLRLTDKGRQAGKKIADKIERVLEQVSVGLSDEQRGDFYRSLAVISDNLDAVSKSGDK